MDGVEDGAQVPSKPPGEVIAFEEDDQLVGNIPVKEIVLQPSKAKIPHVTKLCHAPAVAIRNLEGVDKLRLGLLSALEPFSYEVERELGRGSETKKVGMTRCK